MAVGEMDDLFLMPFLRPIKPDAIINQILFYCASKSWPESWPT